MSLGRVGLIGRWKPLHNGAALLLETACSQADHVLIGIGSSNSDGSVQKYNARNPFTPVESKGMIDAFLRPGFSNYETVYIPDFAHVPEYRDGQMWRSLVKERFGDLDHFITSNPWVENLLKDDYDIIHSWTIVPRKDWVCLRGTEVRVEMARRGDWESLVPEKVAAYLAQDDIVERFRREFGLETLTLLLEEQYGSSESEEQERMHTYEGGGTDHG